MWRALCPFKRQAVVGMRVGGGSGHTSPRATSLRVTSVIIRTAAKPLTMWPAHRVLSVSGSESEPSGGVAGSAEELPPPQVSQTLLATPLGCALAP